MFLDGQIVSTSYSDLFMVYIDLTNKQRKLLSFVIPVLDTGIQVLVQETISLFQKMKILLYDF
ncbi:hypothetical protein OZD70_01295 [Wolbachia endosymbiont of Drosophila tsacasi]|nr:hypothetical protein [Wolbachia endosymbiont of Drosophila tsacasi]